PVGSQLDAQQGGPRGEIAERRRIDGAGLVGGGRLLAPDQEARGAVVGESRGRLVPSRGAQRLGQAAVVLRYGRARRLVAAPARRLDHEDLARPALLLVRPAKRIRNGRIARVPAEEVLALEVSPDRRRRTALSPEPCPASGLDAHQLAQRV